MDELYERDPAGLPAWTEFAACVRADLFVAGPGRFGDAVARYRAAAAAGGDGVRRITLRLNGRALARCEAGGATLPAAVFVS